METRGTVLFVRGDENSEEDIWDDSALITAYDRAVGIAKKKIKLKRETLAAGEGSASESSGVDYNQPSSAKRPNRRKKEKYSSKNKQSNSKVTKQWSVGDRCRAVYSGDGIIYDAEIISIDADSGTCYISYVDYGNREECYLNEIRPVTDSRNVQESSNMKSRYQEDYCSSENDHFEDPPPLGPWQPSTSQPRAPSFQPPPMNSSWGTNSTYIPPMGMPPPLPRFENGGDDEDALASMLMSWYMCGYHTGLYQISPMSLPPPPFPKFENEGDDEDAMASMLMSWYMCGHHTGLYQGLKQRRRQQ